jgi:ribosome-associated toxin RatA of RatAB toxin-antitoxin module
MTQVSCKATVNVSADALWRVISDFGAADQYLTGVVACTVEGEGVGALRTLTSADGGTIVERIETLDAAAHQLSYLLLTDTPFHNCLTTMSVQDLGRDQSEVEWSSTFEPDGIPLNEAVEILEGALSENCSALKRFMEQ